MASRATTKTKRAFDPEESAQDPPGQSPRPEMGQFRLQVDRQTKASYVTYEAAEKAGLLIKKAHPILHVTVYDVLDGVNKIIELPA
ncbi:MAG TPA: hypothetical protein VK456_09610 [Xanthobacteraceae bacterium]|nr:hypothetical protein [Xanthobacteraceae bacterium]